MNRKILFLSALAGLLTVSATGLQGCSKAEPTAAVVNGEAIKMDDFNNYLRLKPQVQVLVNPAGLQQQSPGAPLQTQPYTGTVVGSLGLQALNDLVQQAILRQMAKDEGCFPTDDEIRAELEVRQKNQPDFVTSLVAAGFGIEMIRRDIGLQLAQEKLTTKGITVTPQEVDEYITTHPDDFTIPERADIIWMLVKDEATRKAADADLKSGSAFINVAQRYSVAPNAKANQNMFPEHVIARLNAFGPALMPAIQKAGEQQQTDWIRFTEGFAKFYVSRKYPAEKQKIDDFMKSQVKRQLAIRKGAQGKDVNKKLQQRLKTAKIEITIESLRDPWKKSMDTLNVQGGSTPPAGSR